MITMVFEKQQKDSNSMQDDLVLQVKDLSVELEGEKIINDLSFEVKEGDVLTILGPNGAGKTVLLKTLLGLLLYKGEIKWKKDPDFGYHIVDVDAPQNAALLKKVPKEILNPKIFFEAKGRTEEYRNWVSKMKTEREAFLKKFSVDEEIVEAVVNR